MDEIGEEIGEIQSVAQEAFDSFVQYLPNLLLAVFAILAGWLLARLLRGIVRRVASWANRKLDILLKRGDSASNRLTESAAAVLAEIVFWGVIVTAIAIASRFAGLTIVSAWMDDLVRELPGILVGATIIIGGYVLGAAIGDQITSTARAAKSRQSAFLGKFAQILVFLSALIIGLSQVGIDVTFLIALFAVATGAIFVGFSLAFGLGARDFVSDLVSARDIVRDLKPGLQVRIGAVEGRILEISSTRIALDTKDGRALMPARRVSEADVVILSNEQVEAETVG